MANHFSFGKKLTLRNKPRPTASEKNVFLLNPRGIKGEMLKNQHHSPFLAYLYSSKPKGNPINLDTIELSFTNASKILSPGKELRYLHAMINN